MRIRNNIKHIFMTIFILGILAACSQSPKERTAQATQMTTNAGWQKEIIRGKKFDIASFHPNFSSSLQNSHLTIFLEGDGYAFVDRYTVSKNPTPNNPVALEMALKHGHARKTQGNNAVAYLARPCQFVAASNFRNCHKTHWTTARFHKDILDDINHAITQLKQKASAQTIRLVGYSGGGAVALQMAQYRNDISEIITVAGNLDHESWTRFHKVTPLRGSVSSKPALHASAYIPQIHFIGEDDSVLPPKLYHQQARHFPKNSGAQFIIVNDFDHHCCWADNWPKLYNFAQMLPQKAQNHKNFRQINIR